MQGFVLTIADQQLTPYAFDADRIVAGAPTPAVSRVWQLPDQQVVHGIWEMTEGSVERFDADETFVVISGRGTVEFTDSDRTEDLAPGTLVVMHKGDPVKITVHETLRKVYATRGGGAPS
ncbi:hypothetical protein NIIDNTM18_54110 [Mycolicibacterium litorale]|uniref:(S)-ureidoglycine aminohydrolase cupin domain-containing protein n=1 Tax=Mycolicibacterium litorale TaxID=758802 RepID=A0A6S6P8C0_9MYCO|nr:cupin domain-containing protein [Mycolicibacterium litorale]BCI56133.1 hypothetical protein NIIDNTM18_54110 [Mycolicibacterium litorale]